jgi:hypothetical protein
MPGAEYIILWESYTIDFLLFQRLVFQCFLKELKIIRPKQLYFIIFESISEFYVILLLAVMTMF